jgi:predicted nucleotide-binding protein
MPGEGRRKLQGVTLNENQPYVFVGSSKEGLEPAKALQQQLRFDCEVALWTDGLFELTKSSLDSLLKTLDRFDFAIVVLTPDDLVESRDLERPSPRDNVIFELGLFLGGLGRDRTFILRDDTANLKIPSDLAGITMAEYQPPRKGTWQSAIGSAGTSILQAIRATGIRAVSNPRKAH